MGALLRGERSQGGAASRRQGMRLDASHRAGVVIGARSWIQRRSARDAPLAMCNLAALADILGDVAPDFEPAGEGSR
jgi:hypothetical protein